MAALTIGQGIALAGFFIGVGISMLERPRRRCKCHRESDRG